ncbi:hypothetical protein [Priestia megaterium]|uniref:hypothetical protein n=1 Tax=Priestia megaterium TaxID=1404 RepID=UPI00245328D6|nr:hypothetical protein [Priestia megaterium]MDH3183724.1 hypothetical protein [Priestia megaterium]
MFAETLALELANRVGSTVEIVLDSGRTIIGVLLSAAGSIITVLETIVYGSGSTFTFSTDAVSSISFS